MSEEHVSRVFGPEWVRRRLLGTEARLRAAEREIVRLREMLRETDPKLPHPLDGKSWWELEQN